MSTRETEDGLRIVHKGRGDHRVSKGTIGARSEPRFPQGDVSLFKFEDGQRYSLYVSWDEAFDLADALDALLEWKESQDEDLG